MFDLSDYSQAQRERLVYIDFRLYFTGVVSRTDLMDRFGVGAAAATRDFAQYREIAPDNTELDTVSKLYVMRETFSPLIVHSPERVLATLSQGFGYGLDSDEKPVIPHATVSLLSKPNAEVLAPITRAIHQKKVVKISYTSSSGQSVREIVPFAMGCDGMRWHVRAYDRKRDRFGDFVLTRIGRAEIQKGERPRDPETPANDDQWNRMLELPLVPHPDKKSAELVKLDYEMQDGVLKLRVRAAMAGYVLQQYHVDCSPNHNIKSEAYRLWLKDPLALYGVDSSKLAPGYQPPN
ncbi:WYL domain-containing protein [Pseudomonas sichuanensis]|uniref:helix-turn-helix transcriptional regulator n=1 Tax=Pseudomonas sichuanensis TaxID=2213015 RepID=UPI002447D2DD|nr:WYL domain-containing protein [Pseudomonas sichuanensis]MDH0731469.1 WYL domain-containing protein [Pseudomonas sichuanensis]MDH1584002.1 WYL domain-containing protein [Pseudomonas sichuanensis]MDH1591871.1 WYL domain-containing protein [Pseudomonas sichuanensis]MDH1597354.1 WYL domain-containing protein [Pseudomonas sichuanensis]